MSELVSKQPKEIAGQFNIIQGLFRHGEQTFGGAHNGSASDYYDEELTITRSKLPPQFGVLALGDDPSRYYVAYYDDRRSTYFAEQTRGQSVCLSTQEGTATSNDRLREIIYTQKADGFYLQIDEKVNNRAFLEFEQTNEEGLVKPSGGMRVEYKLRADGEKNLTNFSANRLDEVMIDNNGDNQPARWVRNLDADAMTQDLEYRELFILNRSRTPGLETRADIRFQVKGGLDNPDSITISIGSGPESAARIIVNDPMNKVKAIVHPLYEKDFQVLLKDPNYSFLDSESGNTDQVLPFLRNRVRLLQDDWDKEQSVYVNDNQIEPTDVFDKKAISK